MKIANLIVLLITFFVLLGCESDGEEINLPTPLQEIESEISGEILWKKKILKNPIFGRFCCRVGHLGRPCVKGQTRRVITD